MLQNNNHNFYVGVHMKSSKMLMLLAAAITTVAINAKDYKQYLGGKVDEKGQSAFHLLAKNCYRAEAYVHKLMVKGINAHIQLMLEMIDTSEEQEINPVEDKVDDSAATIDIPLILR